MVCNDAIPIEDPKNKEKTIYSGTSQDEIILINFCEQFYKFKFRDNISVIIEDTLTKESLEFKILKTIEFTSERKMMTSVVQFKDKIIAFCKGSDEAIKQNCKQLSQEDFESLEHLD